MSSGLPSATERAQQYAEARGIRLDARLGFGNDGIIWTTSRKSALKLLERQHTYQRERDVYLRLQDRGLDQLLGFSIPRLVGHDDALLAIEMGIVQPPFLLDFAKAYLDVPPDFSPEILADWERERSALFGRRWREVQRLLRALASHGIFYLDATPGNIRFETEDDDD